MNDDDDDDARDQPRSSRRAFILASSALIAGASLLRGELADEIDGLSRMAAAPGPKLSVGYIQGSGGATSLAEAMTGTATRVVAASTLATGGLRSQSATITVAGFAPGIATDTTCPFDRVFVDAHFSSPDRTVPTPTVPFYAWTFRRSPSTMSGHSRFTIAPGRGMRVGLSVDAAAAAGTVFTSGSHPELPKLQRGVYLVGLQPGMWDAPQRLPAADDPAWTTLPSIVVCVEAV